MLYHRLPYSYINAHACVKSKTMHESNEMAEDMQTDDSDKVDDDFPEDAPVLVQQLLEEWDIGAGKLTHCMIAHNGSSGMDVTCASENMVSRYCWFAGMDHKGSIPSEIRDVVYLLHMTQKYNDSIRVGTGRKSDSPFDISRATPFSAHTFTEQRSLFHKIIVDGQIITLPLFKMRIYIEQAVTGGEHPRSKFFTFLVVETPITFDLVDMVERSCSRAGTTADKFICEDMKKMWVNVACSHRAFGAYGKQDKENLMNISFKVIVYFLRSYHDFSIVCMYFSQLMHDYLICIVFIGSP